MGAWRRKHRAGGGPHVGELREQGACLEFANAASRSFAPHLQLSRFSRRKPRRPGWLSFFSMTRIDCRKSGDFNYES
jgi:hypothetical protein